ncbi:MAG: DUF2961 domain-containing protein [Bacteroidales bacterium]
MIQRRKHAGGNFERTRWIALTCLILCCACSRQVTMESLIAEMASRSGLSYDPATPYHHKQFSSYNRASVTPGREGWFANEDMSHFIRVEENMGHREFVMFDAEGPGAIVRWWMTFYIAQEGIIRVYLDHQEFPVIEGRADQVLSGNLIAGPPFAVSVHEGVPVYEKGRDMDHNFYLPIPFARHCKITYECDTLQRTKAGNYFPDVFYNIGYRAYPKRTSVESFSMEALSRAKPLLDQAKELLENPLINALDEKEFEKELAPGAAFTLDFERKGAAIGQVLLEISASDSLQALRSTVLSASFDGTETIWVPAGDFFGTGYQMSPHQTWMNRTNEQGMMESHWVMPFQKSCRLTYTNYGKEAVKIKGKVVLTDYQWKSSSLYFGCSWHEYRHLGTRDNDNYLDLNFVHIKGKGLYAGDQITLFNTSYQWWGEGDEKIFVDGESFPSSFGTGSEDYYGYAFGRREPFSHPFISQPVGDGNEGNSSDGGLTVNMRHRSLDAIPFTSSISANIELWHWADARVNYALTSYWYVQYPFELNVRPEIESVQYPVARKSSDFEKPDYYRVDDFEEVEKTDVHFHYLSMDTRYMEFATSLNFRLLSPNWDGEVSIDEQLKISKYIHQAYPETFAFLGPFSVDRFSSPGFTDTTLSRIRECMEAGASGIKIWKNIGMVLQDRNGGYIMIDDQAFKGIIHYLEENRIPVMGHLGEPRDCWLPVEEMTDPSDVVYYKNHPQYYMYLHPEVPSYEEQIRARDHLLELHPDLDFTGAHLGSLEWSVDELAKRLDLYPHFKVDISSRIYHLQYQSDADREKVRDFMIKYQDRILYGTDMEVHDQPGADVDVIMENLFRTWKSHWIYLATDSVMQVKGLQLPKGVIDKIYCKNAEVYF